MQDGQSIVFVEVRYRSNQHYGHAAETVTFTKQHKLIKAANLWLLDETGYCPYIQPIFVLT